MVSIAEVLEVRVEIGHRIGGVAFDIDVPLRINPINRSI